MNEVVLMNQNIAAPVAAEDAAWAAINTPLSVTELAQFCQDIERLFRINPMLEFKQWQSLANDHFQMAVKNISQEVPFEIELEAKVERNDNEITIHYQRGIKNKTIFRIEPSEYGSKLTIIEEYNPYNAEQSQTDLSQVDRSLTVWADYLQRFLVMWQRWSKYGWWRWYMRRIWQPMKPSARRIVYIFWWITVVEIALIMLGAAIYWAEYT